VGTLLTFLLCIDTKFDASHSTCLDPQCYKTSNGADEREFSMLDSLISDKERFQDASPFVVQCRYCSMHMPFTPIPERSVCIYPFSFLSILYQNIQTSSPSEWSCLPGVPKTTQTGKHAAAAWSANQGVYWTPFANVGMQENALRLGKVAKYVESPPKTVVNYHCYRKKYELTCTLSSEPRGAKLTSQHASDNLTK